MKRDTKTKAFKTKFSLKQKSQTVDSPPPKKKSAHRHGQRHVN